MMLAWLPCRLAEWRRDVRWAMYNKRVRIATEMFSELFGPDFDSIIPIYPTGAAARLLWTLGTVGWHGCMCSQPPSAAATSMQGADHPPTCRGNARVHAAPVQPRWTSWRTSGTASWRCWSACRWGRLYCTAAAAAAHCLSYLDAAVGLSLDGSRAGGSGHAGGGSASCSWH